MSRVLIQAAAPLAIAALLAACSSPQRKPPTTERTKKQAAHHARKDDRPGCLAMLAQYCEQLDAHERRGNLDVDTGYDRRIQVRLGKNENGVSSVEEDFLGSLSRKRAALPLDFRESLETIRFFDGLQEFLRKPQPVNVSTRSRLRYEGNQLDLESKWLVAVSETVRKRIRDKLGVALDGTDPLDDEMPIELASAVQDERTHLIAQVSRAIWKDTRQWARVREGFERVRKQYLELARRLDVPAEVRDRWLARLKKTKLIFPGQNPYAQDFECVSSETNAFYYPTINAIEVCAGEFIGENFTETIAHEFGHVMDIDTAIIQHQLDTRLGKELSALRAKSCRTRSLSCSDWASFKKGFHSGVKELRAFTPEVPDFQNCSSGPMPPKKLTERDIRGLSEAEVSQAISDFAEREAFSGIISQELRTPGQRDVKNPSYLDACGYQPGSDPSMPLPVDDPVNLLLFAVAEYRCTGPQSPQGLKRAIEVAKDMGTEITEELLRIEGPYSSRDRLVEHGYAFSPVEHFADTLASYAMAGLLRAPMPVDERRAIFLSGSSVGCSESLREGKNPQFASVEQEFALDPHGMGTARSVRRFTQPLREALECRDDLPVHGCELKFKD